MKPDEFWTLPLLERIFGSLNDHEVRWAMLRGSADLADAARDVDLLVAVTDLPALEDVVQQLGGVPLPRWLQGWHRFYWFRQSGVARPGLMLDVVTSLIYGRDGRLPTDLAGGCLARRVRVGSLYELAPTDAFWAVMLHCLLDKGAVNGRRAQELTTALPALVRPSDGEALVAELCPKGWSPDRLLDCVRHSDWEAIGGLGRALIAGSQVDRHTADLPRNDRRPGLGTMAKRHLPRRDSRMGNAAKTAYAAVWRLTQYRRRRHMLDKDGAAGDSASTTTTTSASGRKLTQRTRGRRMKAQDRPVRVSLSGLDGSGKSRQTAALLADLRKDRAVELVWVPFDIWPGSMLKLLPMSVRVRLGPRGRTAATEHLTAEQVVSLASDAKSGQVAPQRSTKPLMQMFWWCVATFAAISAGVSLRRRLERITAELVVLDRYRLDTIVKLQSWYPAVSPTWLATIVLRLTPDPDVECLLRVSGVEAYARKPEQYSVTQLSRQARLYDELVAFEGGVVVVDGEESPEIVTETLRSRVREALNGR